MYIYYIHYVDFYIHTGIKFLEFGFQLLDPGSGNRYIQIVTLSHHSVCAEPVKPELSQLLTGLVLVH